jgi:PKD repeat protein
MQKMLAFAVLLVAAQCIFPAPAISAAALQTPLREAPGRESAGLPAGFLDIITPQAIADRISHLQSLGTRFTYSSKAEEAADYILDEFNSTGLSAFRQSFFFNGYTISNVMAVSPGRNSSLPWCVVGAHYDSINGTDWSFNPYAPAPGADDDASGVAAVLGLAEAFARAPTNRTIIFAAFTGEEQGRIGSTEFVRQLKDNGTDLAAAVCFDMIGYNHRYPKVDIVSDSDSLWLAGMARTAAYQLGLLPETVVSNDTPVRWSDPLSFWEAGYPSIYFIEDEDPQHDSAHFRANPHYHTGGDTLDTLNLSLMTSVARAGAATVANLAGLALPDFRPVIQPRPRTALVGEPAVFNISVLNIGEPVSTVNVSLFVDGCWTENRTLVPDGISFGLPSWTPPEGAEGSHLVTITANPDERIIERDRSDNTIVVRLEVTARPDLYISDLWASDPDPLPGQHLYIYAWVGNSGGAVAACALVISSDDGTIILDSDFSLHPGEVRAVIAAISAPSQPVNFSACITRVQPWESDAGDNQRTLDVTPHVLDMGDLSLVVVPEATATLRRVRFEIEGADVADGLQYFFDFGDGQGAGWTDASSLVHIFTEEGTFNASVIVRDARGASAALAPVPVLVIDQHPVPIIETNGTAVHAGVPAVFSSERSYDPDGIIEGRSWDFGDGGLALGPVVSHVFNAPRSYIVRFTVVDGAGYYNITTMQVGVIDDPPSARILASSRVLLSGETIILDASSSTDGDGRILAYEWSFGDAGAGTGQVANHSFSAPGSYFVTLNVTDDMGVSNSTTTEIYVFARLAVPPPTTQSAGPRTTIIAAASIAITVLLMAVIYLYARKRPGRQRDEEE